MEKTKGTRTDISVEEFDSPAFIGQKFVEEKNLDATSGPSKKIKKAELLSERTTAQGSKVHKRSETKKRDKKTSIFTEKNNIHPELLVSETASQIGLGNDLLTDINPKSRNIEESYSQNEDAHIPQNLGDKILTNQQITDSNLESSEDQTTPDTALDSDGSTGKGAVQVDDNPAVPGPSCLPENSPQAVVKTQSQLMEQTVEEMEKSSQCFACDQKISKHFKDDANHYKCCQCKYKHSLQDFLLRHITRDHLTEPYFCSICKVRFSKVSSHESMHTCDECGIIYRCVTQLEYHYSSHDKVFYIKCILCKTEIDKHFTDKEERVYKCCNKKCLRGFDQRSPFRAHLYTHSDFKLYKCVYCVDRFRTKSDLSHHLNTHPVCAICGEKFVDLNSVYAHALEKH